MNKNEWFASWFDTSYYHSLYKNRDEKEAKKFIVNLVQNLGLQKDQNVLDLACGKGRHSITLNELGMNVKGVDLSPNSIKTASLSENDSLKFSVQDMREAFTSNEFEVIFNLFTSFGYFDKMDDNLKVIQAIKKMLKKDGVLVIDFMNSSKVISNLVPKEIKKEDDIDFHITREYDGNHIYKHIKFNDNEEKYHYTEKVQALKYNDFKKLLQEVGFNILKTYGDFDLNPFNESTSDRLILIAKSC